MQCFLWRDLDPDAAPSTYQVLFNNIGVKPAWAVTTVALRKCAKMHEQEFQDIAIQVVRDSYVDNLV